MTPTWYNLADFLIERFPHLKHEIEAEYLGWLDTLANPYPHAFLENYLVPELLAAARDADAGRARIAFDTLDELLAASDGDLAEATLLSVVEPIVTTPELFALTKAFMGPRALSMARGIIPQLSE